MINFELQVQLVKRWVVVVDFVRSSANKDQKFNELHLNQSALILHRVNSRHQTLYETLADARVLVHEAGRLEEGQSLLERDVIFLGAEVIEQLLDDWHVAA